MSDSGTHYAFEAIGTSWNIDIDDPLSPEERIALLTRIKTRIDVFDRDYSRFRADSLVTEMSQKSGTYVLPIDAEPMMQTYDNMYRLTGGAMTPLIGQVLVDAGYDANYSLVSRELHHPPAWADVLEFTPPRTLTLKQPALLDFGAIGKGYIIDIVGALLWDQGLRSFCVDAGGDILQRNASTTSLRIGLEDPNDAKKVIGVATITNKSLCGSAGNRRAWGEFHHIINPHTLKSPRDIVAIWAVAETTMIADAMTTALFFTKPEELAAFYQFEYLVMYSDASIKVSPNFPGELYVAK